MKSNILEKTFGLEKRWVNYRFEKVKGKMTKVPYGINGAKASSKDPATWGTFDEAAKKSPQVGIVFTGAEDLLGIDIDHCLEDGKMKHEDQELIAELILTADTYTEISPSGTGLHLFLKVPEGLKLIANKKAPFEAYTSGRYFTVTGDAYGKERSVREVTKQEAIDILAVVGYPWGKEEVTGNPAVSEPAQEFHTDDDLVRRMYASKNGPAIKALADGDLSAYKDDASSADMALVSHLAFWTGKNPGQMERMWLATKLGAREKTQTRKDYRDRTIAAAIKKCREVFEGSKREMEKTLEGAPKTEKEDRMHLEELELLFTYNAKKDLVYTQNTENMCRILRKHPEFVGLVRYDAFKNRIEFKDEGKWRDLEDNDGVAIQTKISIIFSFFGKVGKEMIYDALIKVAKENTIDSAMDYIKAIKWDGEARLDSWLSKTYGVDDNEYHRAVGSNWLKGLVKRIIEPGCKFDYVLVLEGEQGIKKSTSLGVLGGDWHVETTMGTDSKDFFMQFQGKAIIEFSEGETLSRTEVKRLKAVITTQSDKYRPAYGRLSIDFPRRCVFAMTTNQEEYLKDETGNRRWLPVACVGTANVEWLKENRDQLFAEAYERVIVKKETTWEFPEEATKAAQDARRIHDPYEDSVVDWYFNKLKPEDREAGITPMQVFRDVYNSGMSVGAQIDKYKEMQIANILRNVLKLQNKRKRTDGVQVIRWFQDENSMQKFEEVLPLSEREKAQVAFDEF